MATFFTSDQHFGHLRIIELCKRPYKTIHEMHEALVENWNAKVAAQDTVYILGDFSFSPLLATEMVGRLHGLKQFIRGNHDKHSASCGNVVDVKMVKLGDTYIWLSHYPHIEWPKSSHGAWHLYGHCHGNLPDNPNALSMDIGVDCNGYAPVSFDEIQSRMAKKTPKSIFDRS